jgi:hypothetical protein
MEPNMRVLRLDSSMEDAIRNNRCYLGGEQVYFEEVPDSTPRKAKGPGHIYSAAGAREYKNSGTCEFHFDQAFAEPDAEHLSEDEEPMSPEEEEQYGDGGDPWDEPPDDIDD